MLTAMTTEVKLMTVEEIEKELNHLEESYAEALADETELDVLKHVWTRIKELRAELELRK
jgi:hypothetical protein